MITSVIACRHCGGAIGLHWQVFTHSHCQLGDLTPEQRREIGAMEQRLQARLADQRLWGTGITVKRGER
jgi:hypothetical protein